MGMYPPQNYGADFVNSMAATAGMLNDRRRLDLDEKKQAKDAETRNLQNQELVLDNQKKTADAAREKKVGEFLEFSGRLKGGMLKPEDHARLGNVTLDILKDVPYLPEDPAQAPAYRQKLDALLKGVDEIRTLPVNNFKYSREDNVPEINQTLDAYQSLLSKERLGKTFTDIDGSVTGKAGAAYTTSGVGGFMMESGEGRKAGFAPMFSVADAEGNPIVGADGRAVLVPATVDGTNRPDAKLRVVTPEEMITKAGFAYRALDVVDALGLADPERRKQYISNNLPALMGEEGAKEVLKNNDPTPKITTVDPTHDVYAGTKLVAQGKPKEKESTPPPQNSYEKDGYKITDRWDPAQKKYVEVGRNKIREPADPVDAVGKMIQGQTLKDALDRRAKALQKYNAIHGANGSEYITADGSKQTIATGDLGRAREELEAANSEVFTLGGKKISYSQPKEITVNSNAEVVRARYQQLKDEDETAAADYLLTAQKKGYSADSIRYIKGELDNKIVKFSTPPAAAAATKTPAKVLGGMQGLALASRPAVAKSTPAVANQSPSTALSSARPIKSQPGKHLVTLSDGTTWIGSKGAKGWVLESKAQIR